MSTCNILGTVQDSGGNGLDGELRVTLDTRLIDADTTPETVLVPRQFAFEVTAGAIDIDLAESETSQITYLFEFWPENADTDTGFDNQAAISFHAMVPNVASVQFSALTPSGVTTDTLDTSVERIARIIIGDDDLLTALAAAVVDAST